MELQLGQTATVIYLPSIGIKWQLDEHWYPSSRGGM